MADIERLEDMNYEESLEFLRNLTTFGFNFGVGRIEELLKRLGGPHHKLKVIHVGGTNGKGSVSTMIAGILQAGGYKTGIFTSPHLHSYCERYRINVEQITHERIAELLTRLRPHLEQMVEEGFEHPTEFEVGTALGFVYFFEEKVDFLVLEVGLGGAIDSTNVVDPLISVITNVAMDHMDYLGDTIEEIAGIKAGIIKKGRPVVTAVDEPKALEVIRRVSQENESDLIEVHRDLKWEVGKSTSEGQEFSLLTPVKSYPDLQLRLVGSHQVVNAATAVAVIEMLDRYGFSFDEQNVRTGLAKAVWPARLEMVSTDPAVLLDGAHNLHGAQSLRQALTEVYTYKRLILVFGMLGDKEREKVVAQLAPLAQAVIVTKPNSPRAGDWEKIADEVKKYVDEVYLIENIHEAVNKGVALARPDDLVCVTGSLYMVAEAREVFVPC